MRLRRPLHFLQGSHYSDEEELTTLDIFADRAAIRLQVSKVAEAQRKAADAEAIAVLNAVAALFAHRLSNVAGTVPNILRDIDKRLKELQVTDAEITRRLGHLDDDTKGLLALAKHLKLDKLGQLSRVPHL